MRLDKGLLLALVGLLLVLSTLMVLPYLQFVFGAVILGFVLRPLQPRLAARIGETMSALVLVTLSLVAIVLPFFVATALVAGDAMALLEDIGSEGIDLEPLESAIVGYTGQDVDLESLVEQSLGGVNESLFGGAVTLFETFTHLLIGVGLLLFLLFFIVRDADRFLAWIRAVSPLSTAVTDDLVARITGLTRAVLVGHVLIAVVQGGLAGAGLVVTGVPNAVFWTVVMILLGLLPLIGTFMVWAPASVFLVWTGDPVAGTLLFVYGFVVVGISDDYLRPVIVDRYAEVSPSVVIVGVIGGLSVFGFMGLFVGPIVIGALRETIEVYDDHYGGAAAANR